MKCLLVKLVIKIIFHSFYDVVRAISWQLSHAQSRKASQPATEPTERGSRKNLAEGVSQGKYVAR